MSDNLSEFRRGAIGGGNSDLDGDLHWSDEPCFVELANGIVTGGPRGSDDDDDDGGGGGGGGTARFLSADPPFDLTRGEKSYR